MLIAFTHNLQLSTDESQAEFDTPETVAAIAQALERCGHRVEPVEVGGPASRVVARREALSPDLVFNTAEGVQGRYREAFYPALFDQLSLPFTCSDAYACALTLDKHLTKTLLRDHGVPLARGGLVRSRSDLDALELSFPAIVKPNYEGSSMGITGDSIAENGQELRDRVMSLLERYPAGVLVEEFVVGRDLVVPFLEAASPETGGVLEPASYSYAPRGRDGRYRIYDYHLKSVDPSSVSVVSPAEITPEQREDAIRIARQIYVLLGIRDAGRVDFRVGDDGKLRFLEINALPSFEPGASLYASAARAGLSSIDAVMDAIVRSAARRYALQLKTRLRRAKARVGLAFNVRRELAQDTAEHDSPETVVALRQAIQSYGHEVVELEATPELPSLLPAMKIDVVFNVAEGFSGRNRESQVPALLELLGIPYTGSDPATLSLALDKGLAKRLVAQAGFRTPAFCVMTTGRERLPTNLEFPLIVKPLAEGSSKGIVDSSVVETEQGLRELVREVVDRYRQAVLVESFLPGREFTVGLLGERRPKALPIMEVCFSGTDRFPTYSFTRKFQGKDVLLQVPAQIDPPLRKELERVGRGVFRVLGCRDVARVDMRLDHAGRVHFVECNPLPGLAPGFSDLCLIAEAAGLSYRALVGEILAPALRRWREKQRTAVPPASPAAPDAGQAGS